jgi:hypothetical protein
VAEQIPLNQFRTVVVELTEELTFLYQTPARRTSIVLGAQATNITGTTAVDVSFVLRKNGDDYLMLDRFSIPPRDAAEVTTGKLVIEEGSSVWAQAGASGSLNLVLSLLETSNE